LQRRLARIRILLKGRQQLQRALAELLVLEDSQPPLLLFLEGLLRIIVRREQHPLEIAAVAT